MLFKTMNISAIYVILKFVFAVSFKEFSTSYSPFWLYNGITIRCSSKRINSDKLNLGNGLGFL